LAVTASGQSTSSTLEASAVRIAASRLASSTAIVRDTSARSRLVQRLTSTSGPRWGPCAAAVGAPGPAPSSASAIDEPRARPSGVGGTMKGGVVEVQVA
jgi:hypothetical protein